MADLTITLSETAARAWADKARREGFASADAAVAAWAEQEITESRDESRLLEERFRSDVANDIPLGEAVQQLAGKHGITGCCPRGS